MEYKIVELPKAEWKDVPIPMVYTTDEYFDLEFTESSNAFEVKMVKKKILTSNQNVRWST